jgi:hypothetical protein
MGLWQVFVAFAGAPFYFLGVSTTAGHALFHDNSVCAVISGLKPSADTSGNTLRDIMERE